jgi:putative oxidoreductase
LRWAYSPATVAFILAVDMAFAYFMAHAPRGFFPLLNGG